MATIRIQREPFDSGVELAALAGGRPEIGALVSFTGLVRDEGSDPSPLERLHIEHYPAMTERRLADIAEEAERRFGLHACLVIHRHGDLRPNEPIVFVATAAAHRGAAFDGARFLMDWLKTDAPFWKREDRGSESRWVEARAEDEQAAARWSSGPDRQPRTG